MRLKEERYFSFVKYIEHLWGKKKTGEHCLSGFELYLMKPVLSQTETNVDCKCEVF